MPGFSSFLRSAPLAVFGSAAARAHELDGIDEIVRTPLPLSRRIGFVQLRGGAGASSTAAYVANLLAHRRGGPVLGVDASRGRVGLLAHAGLPDDAAQHESVRRATAQRAGDAVDGLPRTASGLWMMSLAPGHIVGAPASVHDWFERCSPITRFFDLVVTDWGVRDARIDLAQTAAASHVLCIVARADRHSAEQAASVVEALRLLDRPPAVVVALVDVGGTSGAAPRLLAAAGSPVSSIPFDRARSRDHRIGSSALATRTRLAYGRLAQRLVTDAVAPVPDRAGPVAVAAPPPGRRARRRGSPPESAVSR